MNKKAFRNATMKILSEILTEHEFQVHDQDFWKKIPIWNIRTIRYEENYCHW